MITRLRAKWDGRNVASYQKWLDVMAEGARVKDNSILNVRLLDYSTLSWDAADVRISLETFRRNSSLQQATSFFNTPTHASTPKSPNVVTIFSNPLSSFILEQEESVFLLIQMKWRPLIRRRYQLLGNY